MTTRKKLFTFFLWWSVFGFSIWLGGTIFSMTVVVPMWSEAPPQSVKEFFSQTSFNKYIFNFFWTALDGYQKSSCFNRLSNRLE